MPRKSYFLPVWLCLFLTAAQGHNLPWVLQRNNQQSVETRQLEVDLPVERTLTARELHRYEITFPADRYVQAVVEQRGINLSVTVSNAAGATVTQVDREKGTQGSEPVNFITDAQGIYRFEIEASEKNAAGGSYQIRILSVRLPTAEDRALEEARRLSAESQELRDKAKYDEAFAPAERALNIRERVLGGDNLLVADSLHDMAGLCDDKGDYVRAEPLNQRALAIRQKALGPDHPDVARSLFNLAWIYLVRQDYAKSESFYQRALEIQEKAFGSDNPEVATTLNDFAILYHQKGDYEKAAAMDQRVLAIREKTQGPDSAGVAKSLNNLALDYFRAGDYDRAEPLLQRAVPTWEKARGPDHPQVAIALNNLALLYMNKGDYERAEPLQQRVLAINEKSLGPEHSQVGIATNNLAYTYEQLRDYARAEPLFRRALAIREKAFGPDHTEVGEGLNNLGHLLFKINPNNPELEPMFLRSLAILEKTLGPDHPKVAAPLRNLAALYERRGELVKAEELYQKALAIYEKTLGPNHPEVAATLDKLAQYYQTKGDVEQALEFLERANEARERSVNRNLSLGSERQKLRYLDLFSHDTDDALSLHARLAPHNQRALELAFVTLLQRKGRALDAMSDSIALLRSRANKEDQTLFSHLANARRQLASLTLKGPDKDVVAYHKKLEKLTEDTDKLEADVSARSAQFRSQTQPISLRAVQAAIPQNAALIEFARYDPQGAQVQEPTVAHYAAYVMSHDGAPKWVELGEAAIIDRLIDEWRMALRDSERKDVASLARAVDDKLMKPVRGLLGPVSHLLISPDGPLNLIPFAALVDEQHHYLIEKYTITYLTSGRDLLRLEVHRDSKELPVVIAEPSFGPPALVAVDGARQAPQKIRKSQVDYAQMFFGPLPGVGDEVRTLRTLLTQATFLTGDQATKAALEQVKHPIILHIATHGFFLASPPTSTDNRKAASRRNEGASEMSKMENPLLRSGLALAGANQNPSDGILTAFEAISMDLWGTKLVVLSACDTGLGEVRNGDGVYGLRRALVLAGAESQMMSLWPVSDRSTRDLMAGYYESLMAGQGRSDALRKIQLQMLQTATHNHPYYWAGFIQTGEWANLQGKR